MAFFTSGGDREKLMILFALKTAVIPLSREQITEVMVEFGTENYFGIARHIIELEETACIATVPAHRLQTIVLTKRGDEIVNLFSGMLPKSSRDGIADFIARNIDKYRTENTAQAETRSRTDGDFTTSLALVENGEAFFEIRIRLPAAKYTRLAERRWDKVSKKLYMDALLALTTEADEADDVPFEPSPEHGADNAGADNAELRPKEETH